ncbi:hypothetical protein [Winogradskyella vincentii]|uniref:Uncharacterized protein n=1 Tax=Winogradskyella vincentii TaxID=2877122 RepID=A0ABS7Y5J8_9FLAO|nr:hypothetical protein [Winogradskyella vincentii]MCA0154107.1 hypothetical protein [Winogradskyella vincentii]
MKTVQKHFKFLTVLIVLLLLPITLSPQEEEFRIITNKLFSNKLDTIYGKQHYDGKKVKIIDSKGNSISLPTFNILSVRKEIEGWQYFEWEPNGFTDYLKVDIDSMSCDELFNRAIEWIKESFITTEHNFLIQKDSVFAEYEGRKRFRNSYYPKGYVNKIDFIPRIIPDTIIPEFTYKFTIDKENYKITLTAYNPLILKGGTPGTTITSVAFPEVFYTVELKFFEGSYTIDPVQIFYCYLYEDQSWVEPVEFDFLDMPSIHDIVIDGLRPYGRVYYYIYPFETNFYKKDSGKIRQRYVCLLSRIEIHFNDLNRSLFNYVNGQNISPDLYVYYPETNCRHYWRKW